MMKQKFIIFDLDGTLTDSSEGITNCIEYALCKMGINVPDKKALYKYIGPPLIPAFIEDYGMTESEANETLHFYRERFLDKGIYENKVYDGVSDMLDALKKAGKKILLATTKPEPQAIIVLEHFSLIKYFDVISGSTLDSKIVEKNDIIELAFNILPEARNDSVMVGDRKYDVWGAKHHKITSIGVLYGYGTKEELETVGADILVHSVNELKELLLN